MSPDATDPVVRSSRREAIVIAVFGVLACAYTIGVCYWLGYQRPVVDLTFVWGIPDWVFWGIVVPWFVCFGFSTWFVYGFMEDDPIEEAVSDDAMQATASGEEGS